MNFFQFLRRESDAFQGKLLGIFAVSGVINFFIIVVIVLSVTETGGNNARNLILFILCILIFIRIQKYAMDNSSVIVERITSRIRLRLADQIRNTDLATFENIGESQLLMLLTQETNHVSEAAKLFSRLCSSATNLLVAFAYISYLSLYAFLATVALIMIGVQIYMRKRNSIEKDLRDAAELENQFFTLFRHMLNGFKELKINNAKSNDLFHNQVENTAILTQEKKVSSEKELNNTIIFAQVFSYTLMGIMIFLFPELISIEDSVLIQIVSITLFITTGPLQEVVGAFPAIERANLAVQRLEEMDMLLQKAQTDCAPPDDAVAEQPEFQTLECRRLGFEYPRNGSDSHFHIGPISFSLRRGEVVFFMGGNGAGKSTLLKVLTGLYHATEGQVLINGQDIEAHNMPLYRSYFSIIFQDMHLFDRLYGVKEIDPALVDTLLRRMVLDQKTSILRDGRFSNTNLSTGQKKRLALIVAELDNRDIFVFDEWAADQDPPFRRFFYEEYLPELKARGKTVIAVTHDDKYYNRADRVFKMEYGILSEVGKS